MNLPGPIRFLLIVILLVTAGSAGAQLYFKAKTITTANGLSDNRVTCFYKDSKGFMWIGTRNGLNRYDGHAVKIFRPGAGNSISNEVVNDIAEDSKGIIWVATMEGLNSYDPEKDHWECLRPSPVNGKNSLPNFIVWDIRIAADDNMWIACDVFAFSCYAIRTKTFRYYDWPAFARQHPVLKQHGYRSVQKFIPRNASSFWLGTTNGLVSLDINTGQFQFHGGGYGSDVTDMRYDSLNKIVFISGERGRLYRYDETPGTFATVEVQAEPYPSTRFSKPGKQEIWMASADGIVKINDTRTAVILEKNIPQLAGSILPGGTRSVYKDDKQIRWVATMNGVSVYDATAPGSAFLPLIAASDKEGNNSMGGVYYDVPGHSYFVCAIDSSCVFIVDAASGIIRREQADASGRPFSLCITIKTDRAGNPWLLTGTGVYRYNRATGKFQLFPTPNGNNEVVFRDMVEDKDGNYWFSTFGNGVLHYNKSQAAFVTIEDEFFNGRNSTSGLAIDEATGKLILGTFGEGVYLFDLASRKKTGFFETDQLRDYSQLLLVNSVSRSDKTGIWLSTYSGGVFRYNSGQPYERTFSRYDMRSGLSNNSILSSCSDEDSTIWLLSGRGLSAMTLAGKFLFDLGADQHFSFSTYGSDPRYPHDIYYSTTQRELMVAVGGGLLIYSPQRRDSSLQFPLSITSVRLGDRQLTGTAIYSGNSIQLPYQSNAIGFDFAGLYYGIIPGIRYEYKLEGYDKNWVDAGEQFTAQYQNLPPGHFNFRVRARTADGRIAGEVEGFSFRIVPPFWRTTWFIVLVMLILLTALGWTIYSLLQKLKMERLINSFATSLYGQNTTDDIFWDTAKNCIEKLGFTDCVIYQRYENRDIFIQKAAYGPKNPYRREIANVIEIPVDSGIVGAVAKSGKAMVIGDTSKDHRYIVDDERRFSEITVPVFVDGKVFAVIDSEHARKHFYKRYHLRILKKVAAICSERITKHLAEERLRAKIARDLHDEMGSTLTSINIISKVAMEGAPQPDKWKSSFQKIKDHSGRMMESMSDMVWVINPVNDNFEKVILRMKEFAEELLDPARINYHFAEQGALEKVQLNIEQRKDIYMIFKEALNNIVKYSEASLAEIVLEKKESLLLMTIHDNGKGFEIGDTGSGNGLKNMHSRAEEMGARLAIESAPGSGTRIRLELIVT